MECADQPTDVYVKIFERVPRCAECNLPDAGFVFFPISHDYKISLPGFFGLDAPAAASAGKRVLDDVALPTGAEELAQRSLGTRCGQRKPDFRLFAR
jgi:hypothetical protein